MSIDLDTAAATNKPTFAFPGEEPRSPQEVSTNQAVVILSVRLRNLSTNLIFSFFGAGGVEDWPAAYFEVTSPSGKEVAIRPEPPIHSSGSGFIRLGPGQTEKFAFHVNLFCNFSEVGTYRIVGKWRLRPSGNAGALAEPVSNPLEILVSRNPWKAEKIASTTPH